FASSNSVYENNEDKKEDSDLFPDLVYPLTKKWGEELCSAYNENYGLETVSLRFSNVYGPAANSEREQPALFSYLIRELLNNRTPTIYNSSKARRDYIYVDDLCELLYLIAHQDYKNRTYNASSGETLTTLEIYHEIASQIYTPQKSPYPNPNIENSEKYWNKFPELFEGKYPL